MKTMHLLPIAALACLMLQAATLRAEGVRLHLMGDTTDSQRINFVILAEGYTASQQSKFTADVQTVIDGVFSTTPYAEYATFFNVWGVFVSSAEAGADHPLQNIQRNTYFEATFGTDVERLVTVDNGGKVYDLLAEHVPDYDVVVVLVNDDQYGGSGGAIAVATTNSASVELVLHETGHAFAELADEYDYYYSISPYETINVTAKTTRSDIRWNAWIGAETPLPTPKTSQYADVVGLFEGAMYQPTGWYRPKLDCKMRNLNVPFCEVCAEGHVARFYSIVTPVRARIPDTDTVVFYKNAPAELGVRVGHPNPNTMAVTWYLDGDSVADGESLNLGDLTFADQFSTVTATVVDTTPLVRIDAEKAALRQSVSWTVCDMGASAVSPLTRGSLPARIWARVGRNSLQLTGLAGRAAVLEVGVYAASGRRITPRASYPVGKGRFALQLPLPLSAQGVYFVKVRSGRTESVLRVCGVGR
jgi:hypothetical protein